MIRPVLLMTCRLSSERRVFPRLSALLFTVALLAGCQAWQKSQRTAVESFAAGQTAESRMAIEDALQKRRTEEHLLLLERSILDLADGRTASAEETLRTSRRLIDDLVQADAGEQVAAMASDDRATAWSGREYERRMIVNLLTVASLLNGGEDAFAYSLQLTELCAAERSSWAESQPSPEDGEPRILTAGLTGVPDDGWTEAPENQVLGLASWLRALVQSEHQLQWEECDRSMAQLAAFCPEFAAGGPLAATFGTRCPQGQGGVHVLFLVGQSPEWVAERVQPTSAALLIADRILSATGKHSLPPTVSAVKIAQPCPLTSPSALTGLQCSVTGSAGDVHHCRPVTLVDLNAVAEAEYMAGRDDAIARAVVRRVVKKGAVVAAKQAGGVGRSTGVDLAVNVAGVAWEAMEQADVRSWRMLPARIETADIALPAGDWSLQVGAANGFRSEVPVTVTSGRNTLVVCLLPGTSSASGRLVVSGSDASSTVP